MSEGREPHPLDDIEISPGASKQRSSSAATQPLLRYSVWVIAGSFAVLVLSGIGTSVAEPNSFFESLSSALNRLSGLVMLAGFCGVLLAYRIPYLLQLSDQRAQSHSPILAEAAPLRSKRRELGSAMSAYARLVVINVVAYIAICVVFAGFLLDPWLGMWGMIFFLGLIAVYAGLLVTMAIWHTNYLRAYAVGVLTVIVLMLHSAGGMTLMMMQRGGRTGSPAWTQLAIPLGIALLTGLICAGYVTLLTGYREMKPRRPD